MHIMEVTMAKINGVSNIENTNYQKTSQKVNIENVDFESYLGESKSLDQIFEKAAQKYNVPVNLLKAIGKQESNFNPRALSHCGAQGIMQLMPATAKGLGVTNAFDPEQNIMAGAKYISDKIKKYDGNVKLALAAYNAGSGNVAKYGGIPPFKETQNYVKKVMGYYGEGDVEIADKYNYAASNAGTDQSEKDTKVLHVASVSSPALSSKYSYLFSNDATNGLDTAQDLNDFFSYDDYLNFLDLFLEDEKDNSTDETEKNNSSNINYNPTVLNLLLNQKGE